MNGPIVLFLAVIAPIAGPGGEDVDGELTDDTSTNADLEVGDFAANPDCGVPVNNIASLRAAMEKGLIYLNVHSEFNPPGEVRAQLLERKKRRGGGDDDDD
ncbi:MAG: CHRD domain-containing protein [Myxococcota bacterium]|nr:CHRD domain-containing protein [Myxococcota bacterium]